MRSTRMAKTSNIEVSANSTSLRLPNLAWVVNSDTLFPFLVWDRAVADVRARCASSRILKYTFMVSLVPVAGKGTPLDEHTS